MSIQQERHEKWTDLNGIKGGASFYVAHNGDDRADLVDALLFESGLMVISRTLRNGSDVTYYATQAEIDWLDRRLEDNIARSNRADDLISREWLSRTISSDR